MNIQELAQHPEMLNRKTLYDLRQIVAEYPYYQLARLMMLKNLYLLHDPDFDEELQRASIHFTDRRTLFNLVEAAHYRLKHKSPTSFSNAPDRRALAEQKVATGGGESRTVSLIDSFLSTMPEEEKEEVDTPKQQERRKPTAADATVDYVAYLLSTDFEELDEQNSGNTQAEQPNTMNGGDLIDAFIKNDGGRITLQETPEYLPDMEQQDKEESYEESYLTETLAGIYIKQGRYEKALDIMHRIDKSEAKKNPYFEDQQRFLEKLIKLKAHKADSSASTPKNNNNKQ